MSNNSTSRLAICAPLIVGLVATPLLATTPQRIGPENPTRGLTISVEPVLPQYAQVGGNEIDDSDNGGSGSRSEENDNDDDQPQTGPSRSEVSNERTAEIVEQLEQFQRVCQFTGDEYKIDCFGKLYKQLANEIPRSGDYAEARQIILEASRQLSALSRSNRDRNKPTVRARVRNSSGRTRTTPPIAPVKPELVPQLNRQAASIVAEAETKLLRSASSDAKRAIHYQRIAAAVGSNKVLLRSA